MTNKDKTKPAYCSQCGKGYALTANTEKTYHTGFSHCKDHKGLKMVAESKKAVKEGHQVVMHVQDDHEVSMAQGDLYQLAKKAIELHSMLDRVDNLEGWVQAKITLAADYVTKVHDYLDHEMAMQGNINGLQEPMMGEAVTIKPTGATTSAKVLPPQTKQMVQKVSQGLNKNQNQVMTDKNGNVSVVAKKDVDKAAKGGMMSVTEDDVEEVRLVKSPRMVEAGANMSDGVKKVLSDVVNDRKDAYDVLSHPKDAEEQAASKIMQDMYDDIVVDNRLHPDDDFEQIIEIVVDRLAQDYGLEETSFADAGDVAGGVLGGIAGAALGKNPAAATAGAALGAAAGTAAGKWVDKKLGEDDDHVGDDNIVYQMRKVINLRGQYEVKFADGSKTAISPRLAAAAIEKYNSLRLPADKLAFVRAAGKNIKSLMATVGVQQEAAQRAKKIFGEDWGSSDTTAAIDYMKDVIRQSHGGKYNPDTIEDAAHAAAEVYYDSMGYDNADDAAESLMGHFVRRWMGGSLRAD